MPRLRRALDREKALDQQAAAPVHHQHAPAGRVEPPELRRQAHHAGRPEPLRRRAHYLHAYRLDEPLRRGHQHGAELCEKQPVGPIEVSPTQHFTQPPPRFSEASLVKKLEEEGIGRPSTYASIIQTIQDREYVQQQDRRFYATMLGSIVTDKLIQAF